MEEVKKETSFGEGLLIVIVVTLVFIGFITTVSWLFDTVDTYQAYKYKVDRLEKKLEDKDDFNQYLLIRNNHYK